MHAPHPLKPAEILAWYAWDARTRGFRKLVLCADESCGETVLASGRVPLRIFLQESYVHLFQACQARVSAGFRQCLNGVPCIPCVPGKRLIGPPLPSCGAARFDGLSCIVGFKFVTRVVFLA
jgi:hypothetical protein